MKALSHQTTKQTLATSSPEAIARKCAIARIVWAAIAALALAYAASAQPAPPPAGAIYLAILAFAWVHPRLERQPNEIDLEHLAHGGAAEIIRRHELQRLGAAFAQQKVAAFAAFVAAVGAGSAWLPAIVLCLALGIRETYFRRPRTTGC